MVDLRYHTLRPTFIFDGNRKLQLLVPFHLQAVVDNPPIDFVKEIVNEYLSGKPLIKQISDSYRLEIFRNGYAYLDFLIDGEELPFTPDGNVYVGAVKRKSEIAKRIKEWSKISKELGFSSLPPETFTVKDGCEAVKLCTQLKRFKEEEIPSYVTETLCGKLDTSRLSLYGNISSLTMDKNEISFYIRPSFLNKFRDEFRNDVEFALKMMGELKEPRVGTYIEVESWWDGVKEWYAMHKDTLDLVIALSTFPLSGAIAGAIVGYPDYVLLGAGIGAGAGLGLDGILGLYKFYINLSKIGEGKGKKKKN